jgi:long-chain acyl-CoA synthetase
MVIGENRKFPSALIVPNFAYLQEWCGQNDIPFTDRSDMVAEPRVVARVEQEVQAVNAGLGHWEQIKKTALLTEEWTVDGGEFTPSMKLRRKPILAKYAPQVEQIYT